MCTKNSLGTSPPSYHLGAGWPVPASSRGDCGPGSHFALYTWDTPAEPGSTPGALSRSSRAGGSDVVEVMHRVMHQITA